MSQATGNMHILVTQLKLYYDNLSLMKINRVVILFLFYLIKLILLQFTENPEAGTSRASDPSICETGHVNFINISLKYISCFFYIYLC